MPGYALQTKTAISSQIQSVHMDKQINIYTKITMTSLIEISRTN